MEMDLFDILKKYEISSKIIVTYLEFLKGVWIILTSGYDHTGVLIDRNERTVNENTQFYLTPDNENAFERLKASLNKTKFTWTQFYVDSKTEQVKNLSCFFVIVLN